MMFPNKPLAIQTLLPLKCRSISDISHILNGQQCLLLFYTVKTVSIQSHAATVISPSNMNTLVIQSSPHCCRNIVRQILS